MQTDSWGPNAWETFNHVAFGSPIKLDKQDKEHYKSFYHGFQCVIPCSLCKSAYKDLIKYILIDDYLDSRDGLCYWTFVVHNLVNRKLDKTIETLDNVIYKYENLRARCGKKDDSERYKQCKATLTEYTRDEAKIKAREICLRYKKIFLKQVEKYYNSDKVLDPKFQRCET